MIILRTGNNKMVELTNEWTKERIKDRTEEERI
jgi:hypothetical protein